MSGWRDTLISLPKRWLSTQTDSQDEGTGELYPELPKLPLPPLEQTLDRYLEYARITVTPTQYERTRQLVTEYRNGLGRMAQAFLEERRERLDNWITDWWLQDMYLAVRTPLIIYSNPGMIFPRQKFNKVEEVAELGARFIDELLNYKETLDRGQLPQETATSREKGQPLCMQQYYRLLGVCRVPDYNVDKIYLPNTNDNGRSRDEHIIVMRRNHFYVIPVKAEDRGRLTCNEIKSQILQVIADSTGANAEFPVGLLTAMHRDKWAKAAHLLLNADSNNARNIELIKSSLCVLCLDERDDTTSEYYNDDTASMHRMIHGGGVNKFTPNRWFDKTIQLIISADGVCGMCYEHSAAEGIVAILLAERLLKAAEDGKTSEHKDEGIPTLLPPPEKLQWTIPKEVHVILESGTKTIEKMIKDFDLNLYTYKGYGKDFIKSCKVSPDAYIQLAIQFANYRLFGFVTPTYESASVRRFTAGRVECIRSAHEQAYRWARAIGKVAEDAEHYGKRVTFNQYANRDILTLFEAAVEKQTKIMVDCILGDGIDNHIIGLRESSKLINEGETPLLFKDESYQILTCFTVSTSQVATSVEGTVMGYGPVVLQGYGVGYNIKGDKIIFSIASFSSGNESRTRTYTRYLTEALDIMKKMLTPNDDLEAVG